MDEKENEKAGNGQAGMAEDKRTESWGTKKQQRKRELNFISGKCIIIYILSIFKYRKQFPCHQNVPAIASIERLVPN